MARGNRLDRNVGDLIGPYAIEEVHALGDPVTYGAHTAEGVAVRIEFVARNPRSEDRIRRITDVLRLADLPGVPRLAGQGGDLDSLWYATELVDGERLLDRLLSGPLDWPAACRMAFELATALAGLHGHGYVHRDLKPASIVLRADGSAALSGFDMAVGSGELERMAELPIGDLAYLAPEVIADPQHHPERADLYALGCVLFEAIGGKPAFPAASLIGEGDPVERALEWKSRADALDPGDGAPPWLRQLVRKATDPVSARRLPDMEAFVGWLEGARGAWAPPQAPSRPAASTVPEAAEPPPIFVPTPSLGSMARVARPPPPATPGPPVSLVYLAASVLGMVTGLAFSALVIVFVQLSSPS